MDSSYLIVVAIIAVVVLVVALIYNGFVQQRNKVQEAFSLMDVCLKKRFDLIPNLVAVVKGDAGHEAETLMAVAKARSEAMGRTEELNSESKITKALGGIMAVVESYPALKADKNFLNLQSQLAEIEDEISKSRRYYNGAVREMNNKIQVFPNNIFASIFGFKAMPMFEAHESERQSVSVNV